MPTRIDLPISEVIALYKSGGSIERLAIRFGVDPGVIRHRLRESGTPIAPRGRTAQDVVGQRFGRLVVVCRANSRSEQRPRWLCRCDCANEKIIRGSHLRDGLIESCGCRLAEIRITHGASHTREYGIWENMKQRCTNPKSSRYDRYGGRGIKMCATWANSFEAFLRDMGACPEGHSVDRIDNDGDYEPGNCRWAPPDVQRNNRSDNRYVVLNGQRMTITQASKHVGLPPPVVFYRLNKGWPVERALGLGAS